MVITLLISIIKKVYEIIKKEKIKYIHAYPSNAYSFSKFLINNNLDVSFLVGFICSSENMFDHQKEVIKKLGLELMSVYGHTEKLVIAGYCQESDYYHVEPKYGFFELIDEKGQIIDKIGQTGELVGTTLDNYGMPLIRFKTGDFAEYAGNYCKHCNRKVPLLKNLEGRRTGRRIFGADNTSTTPTALILHTEVLNYIDGIQYIQKEKGEFTILIIKNEKYTKEHEEELLLHHSSKFSKNTIINIKYVKQLIKQPNGKFLDLISDVT